MTTRETWWAYRLGQLDAEAAHRVQRELQDHTTAIARIAAADSRHAEWLLGEPPWKATPQRIASWFCSHGMFWLLWIFLVPAGSWQQWFAISFAALETLQAAIRRALPTGTVFEGFVGFLYSFLLGLVLRHILLSALAVPAQGLPFALGVIGAWAGLGAGVGLRRRLQLGEMTWSLVAAQVLFAEAAIWPIGLLAALAIRYAQIEFGLAKELAQTVLLWVFVAGLIGGVMPRSVRMGFADALFVLGEAFASTAVLCVALWLGVDLLGSSVSPNADWLARWGDVSTAGWLLVCIGQPAVWLDVARAKACHRATWERAILPRYAKGFELIFRGSMLLLVGRAAALTLLPSHLSAPDRFGIVWLNLALAAASCYLAWRFASPIERALNPVRIFWWLRGAPAAGVELVGEGISALHAMRDTASKSLLWVETLGRGVFQTARMTAGAASS